MVDFNCIVNHRVPELWIYKVNKVPIEIIKYILTFIHIDIQLLYNSHWVYAPFSYTIKPPIIYNQNLSKKQACVRCNKCYKCCNGHKKFTYCTKYNCYECKDSGYKCTNEIHFKKYNNEEEHCCNQCGNYDLNPTHICEYHHNEEDDYVSIHPPYDDYIDHYEYDSWDDDDGDDWRDDGSPNGDFSDWLEGGYYDIQYHEYRRPINII
jgi:hypothetical protein